MAPALRTLRLALADDHRLVRESLSRAFGDTYQVVATVGNAAELISALEAHIVDCVLLDLDMPGLHGLELLRGLRARFPRLNIVVVTMHSDRLMASAAMREGANGYVSKDAPIVELQRAIAKVCAGDRYLPTRLSAASHRVGLEALHPALRRLTPRQQEVIMLMGEGKSATAIAKGLGVAHSTITFHKQNAMRLLGMASTQALAEFAVLVRNSIEGRAQETVPLGGG